MHSPIGAVRIRNPVHAVARCTADRPKRRDAPCGSFEVAVLNELVAQVVEQRPFKAWVLGSNPSELTIHSEWFSRYRD